MGVKPTYRIKDWDEHFENHESRKVKRAYWVPIPNRHDGKSYRRIAAHSEGVQVFSAWVLLLEVASKMPTRGVLADEDGPLDAEDLAAMTGFPSTIFDAAFNLLTQERFGWLTSDKAKGRSAKSPAISRNLPQSPDTTGETASEWNGTELNGTEGNGKEQQAQAPDSPPFAGSEFLEALKGYEQHRKEKHSTLTATARKGLYKKLAGWGESAATVALTHSTEQGYTGCFQPEHNGNGSRPTKVDGSMAAVDRVRQEIRKNEH